MPTTLRTETGDGVRSIIFCRPEAYNTITPALRDDLSQAIDDADTDHNVRVILLRAEGSAFCAGYGLDWSTAAQSRGENRPTATGVIGGTGAASARQADDKAAAGQRVSADGHGDDKNSRSAPWIPGHHGGQHVWDSVLDMGFMSTFVDAYMKLWYARKPTIAAVQGWCIGGGTDMVLCADIIIAGESAVFGYPPSRVWGTPTTAMWVYRMGFEKAKRYLLTGDEIPAKTAAAIGLCLEAIPDNELDEHATGLARRMAMVPANQLIMLKQLCNQPAEQMGLASSRQLGTLFDGIARHTQEGLDFVDRAVEIGFRDAVRERDDPFEDYGSRKRPRD